MNKRNHQLIAKKENKTNDRLCNSCGFKLFYLHFSIYLLFPVNSNNIFLLKLSFKPILWHHDAKHKAHKTQSSEEKTFLQWATSVTQNTMSVSCLLFLVRVFISWRNNERSINRNFIFKRVKRNYIGKVNSCILGKAVSGFLYSYCVQLWTRFPSCHLISTKPRFTFISFWINSVQTQDFSFCVCFFLLSLHAFQNNKQISVDLFRVSQHLTVLNIDT